MKGDMEKRLVERSVRDGGCLRWAGAHVSSGYGQIVVDGQVMRVHRIAYETWIGPIPPGLEVDHVRGRGCRFRDCINPQHLEAVSHQENLRRGSSPVGVNARKTHCIRGHEFTPENTRLERRGVRWGRRCRECTRQHRAAYKRRRAEREKADG